MEEISFAVVSKPYEDWKFYDDTSSGSSAGNELILNSRNVAAWEVGEGSKVR